MELFKTSTIVCRVAIAYNLKTLKIFEVREAHDAGQAFGHVLL